MTTARRRPGFDDIVELDPWEGATNALRGLLDDRGAERARTEEDERLRREEQRTTRLPMAEWLKLVPETHGPVDLKRFPFQVEPLYSQSAVDDVEQVHEKATQMGWSTGTIRVALYGADVRQRNVLYTFPTERELSPFSQQRFGPVIRASERLQARMRQDDGMKVENVFTKRFGFDGWLHLRGCEKPIESLPIDMAIFDEYDYSNQENIAASEYRVTGPNSAGLIRRLGVPAIPGAGISRLYLKTDQRAWTVRCEACGEWNRLYGLDAFQHNVDQDRVLLVCRRKDCRRALDVLKGEWVAKHPDRTVKGYHAPKLLMPGPRVLAGVIADSRKTRPKEIQEFMNRGLGQAWAPPEGRLALEQVQACEDQTLRPVDPWGQIPARHAVRTMGIDVASVRALNVTIEEHSTDAKHQVSHKLWVGTVEDDPARGNAFRQICRLMDVFNINMACIDNNPDGRFGLALVARYPGRVYRVQFFDPGGQARRAPEQWKVDDTEAFVSLHRTIAYDSTFERFRMQRVRLPPLDLLPQDYAEHLGNLYREKVEEGAKVVVRYVTTGDHDYAQAEAYNLCALELYWRNIGLGMVLHAGPQPLAAIDSAAAVPTEDDDPYGAGEYRAGFE